MNKIGQAVATIGILAFAMCGAIYFGDPRLLWVASGALLFW